MVDLTPRELEVLTLIAKGLTNDAIARAIGISHRTVKHHAATASSKLGADSRAHAVAIALRTGLIR